MTDVRTSQAGANPGVCGGVALPLASGFQLSYLCGCKMDGASVQGGWRRSSLRITATNATFSLRSNLPATCRLRLPSTPVLRNESPLPSTGS